MAEILKTKSQMILRIAELSEQNTLLRDELYRKSETEQALQTALEENAELKDRQLRLAETYQETRNVCKKLIQECEELRKTVEGQKGLITVGGKQQYKYLQEIDRLQQENRMLKEANNEYKKAGAELLAEKNALQIGYDETREAKGQFKKVLERVREDICSFCIECQCECKECTVFEIKTQIDEVLK